MTCLTCLDEARVEVPHRPRLTLVDQLPQRRLPPLSEGSRGGTACGERGAQDSRASSSPRRRCCRAARVSGGDLDAARPRGGSRRTRTVRWSAGSRQCPRAPGRIGSSRYTGPHQLASPPAFASSARADPSVAEASHLSPHDLGTRVQRPAAPTIGCPVGEREPRAGVDGECRRRCRGRSSLRGFYGSGRATGAGRRGIGRAPRPHAGGRRALPRSHTAPGRRDSRASASVRVGGVASVTGATHRRQPPARWCAIARPMDGVLAEQVPRSAPSEPARAVRQLAPETACRAADRGSRIQRRQSRASAT